MAFAKVYFCVTVQSVHLRVGPENRHLLVCRFVQAIVETRTIVNVDKLSVVRQLVRCYTYSTVAVQCSCRRSITLQQVVPSGSSKVPCGLIPFCLVFMGLSYLSTDSFIISRSRHCGYHHLRSSGQAPGREHLCGYSIKLKIRPISLLTQLL